MPKFLVEGQYSPEGFQGLMKDKAVGRKAAVAQAIKKLGGKLDALYYCLGEQDIVIIADLPDHLTAAALATTVCASGVARTQTKLLLTVDETDEALAKAVTYRPAGA